jgi:N4-gp56 family major capsid protein
MAVLTPAITVSAMTNFAKAVVDLVEKKLEENLRSPLPFLNPVNYRSAKFVKGTNNTLRYLNIPDLTATTNSGTFAAGTRPWLEEGTPPASEVLAFGYEEFSAYQAGRTLTVSDKALQENPIDLMANMADKISWNAIETANLWVQDKLKAGANVYRVGGGSTDASIGYNDLLTGNDVKDAVARLMSANVSPFPDGTFHGIIHPFAKRDLMSDNEAGGWIDAQRYQGSVAGGLMNGELGSYGGVRFVESSIITPAVQTGTSLTSVTGVYTTGVWTTTADHQLAVGDKIYTASVGTGPTGNIVAGQPATLYVLTVPTAVTFTASLVRGGELLLWSSASAQATTFSKINPIYSTYILGPDAYAFGDWSAIEVFVTPPGGHTDPLHQSALIGWKGYFGAKILGETFTTSAPAVRYARIASAVALGPNVTIT